MLLTLKLSRRIVRGLGVEREKRSCGVDCLGEGTMTGGTQRGGMTDWRVTLCHEAKGSTGSCIWIAGSVRFGLNTQAKFLRDHVTIGVAR